MVVRNLVVLAQAEHPSDHLAAEAGGRTETGGAHPEVEEARVVAELERAHERPVEGSERDVGFRGACRLPRSPSQAEDELVERRAGERRIRAKRSRVATHQAMRGGELDLGFGPRALRSREHDGCGGKRKGRTDQCRSETSHERSIGRLLGHL
jgi:hypothetical protein